MDSEVSALLARIEESTHHGEKDIEDIKKKRKRVMDEATEKLYDKIDQIIRDKLYDAWALALQRFLDAPYLSPTWKSIFILVNKVYIGKEDDGPIPRLYRFIRYWKNEHLSRLEPDLEEPQPMALEFINGTRLGLSNELG